jgi:hypothetical protein
MPRPTRKKPTLRKIAERGFAFSGTTREYGRIYGPSRTGNYYADRHCFFMSRAVLNALLNTRTKEHINQKVFESFSTVLSFAFGYAKCKVGVNDRALRLSFDKTPIILYTLNITPFYGSSQAADLLHKKITSQVPTDEPMYSKGPFREFEITPGLIRSGYDAWKKEYSPRQEEIDAYVNWWHDAGLSGEPDHSRRDFSNFLEKYIYHKFLVHIIRAYKQEISKRRVQK